MKIILVIILGGVLMVWYDHTTGISQVLMPIPGLFRVGHNLLVMAYGAIVWALLRE